MTNWAMWHADPSKKQAQIILNFSHGGDGRTGIATGRLLVDGDGRTEAGNTVDVRLIHHAEKHARVAGQTLDVTALTFGINRIESQARLARARKPSNHDQLVARDINVEVLQVVLPRTTNFDITVVHLVIYYIAKVGFMQ